MQTAQKKHSSLYEIPKAGVNWPGEFGKRKLRAWPVRTLTGYGEGGKGAGLVVLSRCEGHRHLVCLSKFNDSPAHMNPLIDIRSDAQIIPNHQEFANQSGWDWKMDENLP